MSIKELAFGLEDVKLNAEIVESTAMAIHTAMQEGGSAAETYYGALYGVCVSLFNHCKDLERLMDGAFEILRAQKEVA